MTSSRWSEPSANDKTKGGTQMELSACIVVYNGAGDTYGRFSKEQGAVKYIDPREE